MFLNGELTPSFYADFKLGNIDKCVSCIKKVLNSNGYSIDKKSLKDVLIELYNHEKRLEEISLEEILNAD
jgi:hydroxyacyl-ACP dehydratase HTD2-like protein with hotdog domain